MAKSKTTVSCHISHGLIAKSDKSMFDRSLPWRGKISRRGRNELRLSGCNYFLPKIESVEWNSLPRCRNTLETPWKYKTNPAFSHTIFIHQRLYIFFLNFFSGILKLAAASVMSSFHTRRCELVLLRT